MKSLVKVLALALIFVFSVSSYAFAMEMQPRTDVSNMLSMSDRLDLGTMPFVIGDGYIDVEIPAEAFAIPITPFNSIDGNLGNMTAHFARGQRLAVSPMVLITTTNLPIPYPAFITSVDVSFQIATDPWSGISTHSIGIVHWNPFNNRSRDAELTPTNPLSSFQNLRTTQLNNLDPWAHFDINLIARRDILNSSTDNGATASIRNVNMRINFR